MSTERVDTLKRFNYKLITNSYPTNKFVIKVAVNFNPSNFNTNKKRKKNNKGEEKSYLRKKKKKRTFELLFSLFPIYTFLLIKLVYYKKKRREKKYSFAPHQSLLSEKSLYGKERLRRAVIEIKTGTIVACKWRGIWNGVGFVTHLHLNRFGTNAVFRERRERIMIGLPLNLPFETRTSIRYVHSRLRFFCNSFPWRILKKIYLDLLSPVIL